MKTLWMIPLLITAHTFIQADSTPSCTDDIKALKSIIRSQRSSLDSEEISQIRTTMKAAYALAQDGSEAECFTTIAPIKVQFNYEQDK